MARRNESPEDKRRRELVHGFLKENPIKDPNDIQELMKEMIRQVLQGGLEAELDEELGYTRYDYRNKETENSRNGFSKKTMHTSVGDMDITKKWTGRRIDWGQIHSQLLIYFGDRLA